MSLWENIKQKKRNSSFMNPDQDERGKGKKALRQTSKALPVLLIKEEKKDLCCRLPGLNFLSLARVCV